MTANLATATLVGTVRSTIEGGAYRSTRHPAAHIAVGDLLQPDRTQYPRRVQSVRSTRAHIIIGDEFGCVWRYRTGDDVRTAVAL